MTATLKTSPRKSKMINLPNEIILKIFTYLDEPKDLALCVPVCKLFQVLASDGSLWLKHLKSNFISNPRLPGQHLNLKDRERERFYPFTPVEGVSYIGIAMNWKKEFGEYTNLYADVKRHVYMLHQFVAKNSPITLNTFNAGVFDFQELRKEFEVARGVIVDSDDLRAFVLLYHWIDGQKTRMPHVDAGLFGTYNCYGNVNSLFMFPLKYLKQMTIDGFCMLIFAVCPRSGRHLGIVLDNNELHGHVIQVSDAWGSFIDYGKFKEWFFKYSEDISADVYDLVPVSLQQEQVEGNMVLSIFPNNGPYTSLAVTRGIEIHVSSILQLESNSINQWVYRIRMKFVGTGYFQAQLVRRKWNIRFDTDHIQKVVGDGVVGMQPVVGSGLAPFSYCSICSAKESSERQPGFPMILSDPPIGVANPIWMEGEFTFVPGTLAEPTGEPFQVQVARFSFQQPQKNPFHD